MAQEGAFTIAFMWEIVSRGGLIVGYNVTDDVAIDLHLGAVPHVVTHGVTARIRIEDGIDNDEHVLVGLTRMSSSRPGREQPWVTGLNLGYRYELGADGDAGTYPLEIGICPILHRPTSGTNEVAATEYKPPFTMFLGAGAQWSSEEVPEGQEQNAKKGE